MKGNEVQGIKDGLLSSDLSFLVTASHELKAPLALIRQLSFALADETIPVDERARMIHQVTLTAERALRLTTALSRASRLEDSLFELAPVNPYQICEEVAHELTPLYKANGKEIRVASRHRPMLVVANYELLRRIMLNFGDNALYYAASNAPVELQIRSRGAGTAIRIGVRDYGPAIPIDFWKRLQKNLGKNVQTLHNRPQSSGLGLYIAGQFAHAMQGEVGATRHQDGTTFYVDMHASTQLRLL